VLLLASINPSRIMRIIMHGGCTQHCTWMYSPLDMRRFWMPSHFRSAVNTTVRAGIFRPMAKVSVANSTWSGSTHHGGTQ